MAALQRVGLCAIADPAEHIDFVPQRVHALEMIRAAEGPHNGS